MGTSNSIGVVILNFKGIRKRCAKKRACRPTREGRTLWEIGQPTGRLLLAWGKMTQKWALLNHKMRNLRAVAIFATVLLSELGMRAVGQALRRTENEPT
jgi:hypothetical protein